MGKLKKILTIEDLINFCLSSNVGRFSSKECGYRLSVQVPATFKEEKVEEDDTLLYAFVRLFHVGLNRNGSCVTREAAEKSMSGIKYKPILANFTTNTEDGNEDFTSHDMEFDDDGNIIYIEKQVGCFTSDEPYIDTDEETGKDFVYAKIAIPRDYTSAADIIERKNGTKISVELLINDMSFNSKEKYLELTDIVVQGATLLGTDPNTGRQVEEGMKNAKVSLEDFSVQKNSIFSNIDTNTKLIDALEKLNTTLLSFNINKNSKEGGKGVNKLEELLEKYSKTKEDLTFEVEGLTDEELETKFVEAFGEADGGSDDTTDGTPSDEGEGTEDDEGTTVVTQGENGQSDEGNDGKEPENQTDDGSDDTTTTSDDDEDTKKKKYTVEVNGVSRTFEVSLNDKIYALQDLVNATYGESDNTYYGITAYDDHVIMMDYWYGKAYKQSYKQDGDNFSLTGDRVEVFANWLTAEEEDALAEMRSNYSSIQEKLASYEKVEMNIEKDKVFESEDYKEYLEKEEFKSLIENKEKYSVEELKDKAEIAFARCVREFGLYDNAKNNLNVTSRKQFSGTNDKSNEPNPYGDLFND